MRCFILGLGLWVFFSFVSMCGKRWIPGRFVVEQTHVERICDDFFLTAKHINMATEGMAFAWDSGRLWKSSQLS